MHFICNSTISLLLGHPGVYIPELFLIGGVTAGKCHNLLELCYFLLSTMKRSTRLSSTLEEQLGALNEEMSVESPTQPWLRKVLHE